ncbi:MAG TPA: hypothetical protein VFN66_10420, partial [Burkholderiales bacterium]|nr:hypothetical protein [Burkholderiales bacterium]
ANMSLPQTFHVIDRAHAQRYNVRSWQAGNGALRSNGGNAAVSPVPRSGNSAMRQNRYASPGPIQSSAGAKHDFQQLHLPPAGQPAARPESRAAQAPAGFGNANGYPHPHPYSQAYPDRNVQAVHVPANQQRRVMQRENYGQQSYFGNERTDQRINARRMQPQNQAMPKPVPAQSAEMANPRPAPVPRPRAPVYPRTPPQHD